eukprot:TRINITY_DN12612_c0_g1_i1.p1 TRINITY_DN12612_c0_g1~~TRINITY_DN12612_c0_g1_i1.p1  ORF type:complete len:463 (-),score=22.57 TRINITY_DN12612_c0_g1_i1:78-1466(-)
MPLAVFRFAVALAVGTAVKFQNYEASGTPPGAPLSILLSSSSVPKNYMFAERYLFTVPGENKIYSCVPDPSTGGSCTSESVLTSSITGPFSIRPHSNRNEGYVVVAKTSHVVYTVSDSGTKTEVAGSEGSSGTALTGKCQLEEPKSAVYLSDGSLIIADTGNRRILRKGSSSSNCTVLFGKMPDASTAVINLQDPSAVTVDDAGGCVISDQSTPDNTVRGPAVIHCTSPTSCTVVVDFGNVSISPDNGWNGAHPRTAVYDASSGTYKVLVTGQKNGAPATEIWSCQSGGACSVALSGLADPPDLSFYHGEYFLADGNNLRVCKDGVANTTCHTIRQFVGATVQSVQSVLPVFPAQENYTLKWVAYENEAFNHSGELQYTGEPFLEFYVGDYAIDGCINPSDVPDDGPVKEKASYCLNLFNLSTLVVRRSDTKGIVGAVNCCNNQARLTESSGSGTIKTSTSR